MKTVEVIIPVYKPGKELKILLERLGKQSYPIERILLVNTEKQYWDPRLEKEFPSIQVTHITKGEFDHGGTRRKMAEISQAEVMVFMTQDAMPENRELIAQLVLPMEQERVKAVYARQLPVRNCRLAEAYTRSFNYPSVSMLKGKEDLDRLGIKTYFCSNVCAAYDKKTYEELGGFVEKTIFNEDMIYAGHLIQAGYQIFYNAQARVFHSHNYGCMDQLHRNFDLGVSQAQHPEIFQGVPSEGEGIRMVKHTIEYLLEKRKPWLIPGVILQSAFKYMGYRLGKNYQRLPRKMILKCTMNREYWK